jgi:hypothetical protein
MEATDLRLLVKLKSSLWMFYRCHHDMVNHYGISGINDLRYVPLVVSTSWSFPHSWHITDFVTSHTTSVTSGARTAYSSGASEGSPLVFSWVHAARSLVFCLSSCRSLFMLLSFDHSSIYGFWLPLWYLQALL